mmetsp:Transcript_24450/g.57778  ORF Transcript_24450/g.57778 Transcript_24450/m.57778 type:complete len:399 (-) Transcript_24450:2317-3513(-)
MAEPSKARPRSNPGGVVVTEHELFGKSTIRYIARGPLLLFAVVVSFSAPYLREHCTVYLVVHLLAAGIGLVVIARDCFGVAQLAVRSGMNLALDRFVLDDVLRAVYHPTYGAWACCVGTFVGASSMYGLSMTDDEKTELIQSSLDLADEHQARSLLFEPGGCKALLPEPVRNWLQPPVLGASDSTTTDTESDKSASDCDAADAVNDGEDCDSSTADEATERTAEPSNTESSLNRLVESGARQETRGAGSRTDDNLSQTDPAAVFFRILRNMAVQRIRSGARALPRSSIESLGITSTVVMGIQLVLRRRAHKRSQLICAGIAALSFGTLLSREAILGNIYDAQSMKLVCHETVLRILEKVKGKCAAKKQFCAMLVLVLLCGRRQSSRDIPLRNRSFRER